MQSGHGEASLMMGIRKAPCSDCGMRATVQSAPQLLSVEALDLTTSQYNRDNVEAADDRWNNGS